MHKVPKITSLQYFKKEVRQKFDFSHEDKNFKVLFKLIPSFLLVIARHAQSTQNNKFPIPLQYLKKEERHKLDFFIKINPNVPTNQDFQSGGHEQSCPK